MRKEEYQQCAALVRWCTLKGWLIIHLANEGKRAPWVAKDLGIVAGLPDYMIPIPASGKHALFLEMKAPKRKPSRKQQVFLEFLRRNGYAAAYFDDWKEAAKWIERYLDNQL